MGSWHIAWQPLPSAYECVFKWVNVTGVVKHFERSVTLCGIITDNNNNNVKYANKQRSDASLSYNRSQSLVLCSDIHTRTYYI